MPMLPLVSVSLVSVIHSKIIVTMCLITLLGGFLSGDVLLIVFLYKHPNFRLFMCLLDVLVKI